MLERSLEGRDLALYLRLDEWEAQLKQARKELALAMLETAAETMRSLPDVSNRLLPVGVFRLIHFLACTITRSYLSMRPRYAGTKPRRRPRSVRKDYRRSVMRCSDALLLPSSTTGAYWRTRTRSGCNQAIVRTRNRRA